MANTKRADILREAIQLVHGQRQEDYGAPSASFNRIADRWNQTMRAADGGLVTAYHVALAMADLKLARLANGYHKDSILDAMCYLALAYELHDEEINTHPKV